MTAAGPARPRFREFHQLMRHRVQDVLLVAAPYERFVLEEAGELAERMAGEFRHLDVHYAPGLTGVATGEEALALVQAQRRFNLIVAAPQVADMNAVELARRVREARLDAPVVVLAHDLQELGDFVDRYGLEGIERAFLWQGDARILVAIVKTVEDRRNAPHDCAEMGVQAILLVEDRVRQYSSFLPAMYGELLRLSQRVIAEGLNLSQKVLRMRARPKLLLCTNWEEALEAFGAYQDEVLGIVSDVEFPRDGALSATAGADLARHVRAGYPDIPIVLHSSLAENAELARRLGARFLLKGSPLMLEELGRCLSETFGFGDFVFRTPQGDEVARAADLAELEARLREAPAESILYHAERNHFSRWLKARTAFDLAWTLRRRRPEEYESTEAMRDHLVRSIAEHRSEESQVVVADFDREADPAEGFWRLGGGSLGGKARGLVFLRRLLAERGLRQRFEGAVVEVPTALVLGSDVFDRFLAEGGLRRFAIECDDDAELHARFAAARLPEPIERDLEAFAARARFPLAVRSSSLLEDSQQHPFTGVYDTLMLPNDSGDAVERAGRISAAVRSVYASTFSRGAKRYLTSTGHRPEEEKMAVLVQRVVGSAHGERFYPSFAGVARSVNYYPAGPMRAEDGVVAVALGLGRAVVDGEACLRFCPSYPHHVPQLASVREALASTQRSFWALPLGAAARDACREECYGLEAAEADGELGRLASTYSAADDALADGIARTGARVVTFAPLLNQGRPPVAEILAALLAEGERGMGSPVEFEFAVTLAPGDDVPARFALLQMRPLARAPGETELELGELPDGDALCRSRRALGNGRIEGIHDLVVVDPARFERAESAAVAAEIGRINARLVAERARYVLIGVGRWGSRDPWLGIPVAWEQVCGAAAIVEAGLRDLAVTPSQGSHFFQHLAASGTVFFTVQDGPGEFVDWRFLAGRRAASSAAGVLHLRFEAPLEVRVDGRRGEGVILKPGAALPLDD